MSTLFLTEQGSRVVCRNHTLLLRQNNETLFIYPLDSLERLVLMGRIELSAGAMAKLLGRGIETLFLTRDGRFKGRLCAGVGKNIFLRELQFKKRNESAFCLEFSRSLIQAKIKNCRAFLRRSGAAVLAAIDHRLINAEKSLALCNSLEQMRGIEGGFAALYFRHFRTLLHNPMGFRKRQKHPPPDPVNILLSFGYTLLFNQILALVETAGLDPYAGFFHQSQYGHPALVSDLMEPYRHNVVDRLVLSLVNNQLIQESHFQKEEKGYRFLPEGVRLFADRYRLALEKRFKSGDRQLTLWLIIKETVWQFCRYLEGKDNEFKPYIFR
ncbi:MAG: CRISPR-associated endonuclease Cas1 [Calditrichia bacterium]